jgi:hypothetical protein
MGPKIVPPLLTLPFALLGFALASAQGIPVESQGAGRESVACLRTCRAGEGLASFEGARDCILNCLAAEGIGHVPAPCDPFHADGCCNTFAAHCQDPDCATAELCDTVDNDCDGETDEGCGCVPPTTQACGTDVGECIPGSQECQLDGTFGPCTGGVEPTQRQCDELDRDCDGTPDYLQPPCECLHGSLRECGTDVGACALGMQTCTDGTWGSCEGAVGPTPEVCDDELDNDCNGTTDEGCEAP